MPKTCRSCEVQVLHKIVADLRAIEAVAVSANTTSVAVLRLISQYEQRLIEAITEDSCLPKITFG